MSQRRAIPTAIAIVIAFVMPAVSVALYVIVAIIWIVPDRRFVKDD